MVCCREAPPVCWHVAKRPFSMQVHVLVCIYPYRSMAEEVPLWFNKHYLP